MTLTSAFISSVGVQSLGSYSPSRVISSRPKCTQLFLKRRSVYMVAEAASTRDGNAAVTTDGVRSVSAPSTVPAPLIKPPPGAFQAAVDLGATKASQSAAKVFLLGCVAGCYIAFGALLALTVGGALPALKADNIGLQKILLGAFGLPFGLTMVCTAGGELFTGNTALVTAAALKGRVSISALTRNWIASYLGNFCGSLFIVWLAIATGCLGAASAATACSLAVVKTGLTFMQAFTRGIACNWLVCLGVYLSTAASDFVGKFFAIWLPVSAFVAMGFDHSIANMFFIPLGKMLGAQVSLKAFLLANLLPVTLGNIIGGAVLVALVYYIGYGRN